MQSERRAAGPGAVVALAPCATYDLPAVRAAVGAVLAPLGGMAAFVQPGMHVLLKPNLLSAHEPGRAITTHPAIVQAVAEQVQAAGGVVSIGDSPAGPDKNAPAVLRKSGMTAVAESLGVELAEFRDLDWRRLNGRDYFLARAVLAADLVINLPKIKTHMLTGYSGAIKNLFGTVPGTRKRELHLRAPGVQDFSHGLVDILQLVRPGLTLIDGVIGLEGEGPGATGTVRRYGCVAASADAVALDTVITRAMGYRPGQVLHLAEAGRRGLGVGDPARIQTPGADKVPPFGKVAIPVHHWYADAPAWLSAPFYRAARVWPAVDAAKCGGCSRCAEVCPRAAVTTGKPVRIDLDQCVGCLCCAEVCPHAAISTKPNLLARLVGAG